MIGIVNCPGHPIESTQLGRTILITIPDSKNFRRFGQSDHFVASDDSEIKKIKR